MPFLEQVRKYGLYIAMVAALIGAIGDVLLLYHPDGNYEAGDYLFLADIAPNKLLLGAYLGILFIPFVAFGLFVVYEKLKPAIYKNTWIFVLAIFFTLFPGIAYHATCAYTGIYLRMALDLPPEQSAYLLENFDFLKLLFEPLGLLLGLGFAVLSVLYTYLVLKKDTSIPRWKAYFNPAIFYLCFLAIYIFFPLLGNILVPAAFNLSLFLFFGLIAYEKKK